MGNFSAEKNDDIVTMENDWQVHMNIDAKSVQIFRIGKGPVTTIMSTKFEYSAINSSEGI